MEAVAFLLATAVGFMWGYMWADARRQIRENRMSEFKVGDRVRVSWGLAGDSHWRGREGTLVANTNSVYPWIVTGESFSDKDGEGLPVQEHEIEPVDG